MTTKVSSVAVVGGGTMGSGIAAASAAAGVPVLLLEVDAAALDKALARTLAQLKPEEQDAARALIATGTLADLPRLADYDWICEAVIEDLETKRDLFRRIEAARRDGSLVSTNTSGIPLRAITDGLPQRLRRDIVVTHFFNPVRVMRLLEIVPGAETRPEAVAALAAYGRDVLGKGVVHAKDTVNFIGNRIGCFWMLSGLHKAKPYLARGFSQERVDALLSAPVGLPATGLYGLIDLIGLDVMDLVGRNLAANLPPDDAGHAFTSLPAAERAMLERRQLGRKSGGGFTRVTKTADGGKRKETFDLLSGDWRPAQSLPPEPADIGDLAFADGDAGRLVWDIHVGTLLYAADLVPEIADDVVNVDRALRWGFAWRRGPFELLDHLGPERVAARLRAEGRSLPRLLRLLEDSGAATFYRRGEFLGLDGRYRPVPAE